MNYWLVKSEPETFSIEDFIKEKVTVWYGVRNYQARNNLRAMEYGDLCIFYRSVTKPGAIGICKVAKEHYQDPTTELPAWLAVDLEFVKAFERDILVSEIKATPELQDMVLLKNSRLSVQPVTKEEYEVITKIGANK
jgi:predicted RNA-binding protein with PUA-like domain